MNRREVIGAAFALPFISLPLPVVAKPHRRLIVVPPSEFSRSLVRRKELGTATTITTYSQNLTGSQFDEIFLHHPVTSEDEFRNGDSWREYIGYLKCRLSPNGKFWHTGGRILV